jgi:hypothetical protein
VPLTRLPERCWILAVDRCGDLEDWHADNLDVALTAVAELWAAHPDRYPPIPWQDDRPCLLVQCRKCGNHVGNGEHFADVEHALEAAESDGWRGDVCPFCQPHRVSTS